MGDNKAHEPESKGCIQILGGLFKARNNPNPITEKQEDKQGADKRKIALLISLTQSIAHQLLKPVHQKLGDHLPRSRDHFPVTGGKPSK